MRLSISCVFAKTASPLRLSVGYSSSSFTRPLVNRVRFVSNELLKLFRLILLYLAPLLDFSSSFTLFFVVFFVSFYLTSSWYSVSSFFLNLIFFLYSIHSWFSPSSLTLLFSTLYNNYYLLFSSYWLTSSQFPSSGIIYGLFYIFLFLLPHTN